MRRKIALAVVVFLVMALGGGIWVGRGTGTPPGPAPPKIPMQELFAYKNAQDLHITAHNRARYEADFRTDDTPEMVLAYYVDRLKAGGWTNMYRSTGRLEADYMNEQTDELYRVDIGAELTEDGHLLIRIVQKSFAEP